LNFNPEEFSVRPNRPALIDRTAVTPPIRPTSKVEQAAIVLLALMPLAQEHQIMSRRSRVTPVRETETNRLMKSRVFKAREQPGCSDIVHMIRIHNFISWSAWAKTVAEVWRARYDFVIPRQPDLFRKASGRQREGYDLATETVGI
jgi:hypothetical protein